MCDYKRYMNRLDELFRHMHLSILKNLMPLLLLFCGADAYDIGRLYFVVYIRTMGSSLISVSTCPGP